MWMPNTASVSLHATLKSEQLIIGMVIRFRVFYYEYDCQFG